MGNIIAKPQVATDVLAPDPYPRELGIDGLAIGTAEGCRDCRLGVVPGISSSTAKLSRVFGDASPTECDSYTKARADVESGKIAFGEFIRQFKSGKLMNRKMIDGESFCEVRGFKDSEQESGIKNLKQWSALPWSELPVVRVRKEAGAAGGYSRETKLDISTSIPFKLKFNGQDVEVKRMTLYHPSPIRIDNIQHDAILSLNDPSDKDATTIVLIPIVGSVMAGQSGNFLSRIASFIPGMLSVDRSTGLFPTIDATTGADWNLTNVLPVEPSATGESLVKSGFFSWRGIPGDMIRGTRPDPTGWAIVNAEAARNRMSPGDFNSWKQRTLAQYPDIVTWTPSGKPGPLYIMMEKPILANSFDLQTIRKLPVTPAVEAIHKVPKRFVYKPGPPSGCSPKKGSKETFVDGEDPDMCDPFAYRPSPSAITTDSIIKVILGIFAVAALFIGVYYGLKWATSPTGELFRKLGEKIGKAVSRGKVAIKQTGIPAAAAVVASAPATAIESVAETINPMVQEKKKVAIEPRQTADIKTRRSLATYKSPAARKLTQRGRRTVPEDVKKTEELTPAEEKQVMAEYETLGTTPAGTGLFTEAELQSAKEAEPTIKKRKIDTEEEETAKYEARIAAEEKKEKEAADAEAEKVEKAADTLAADAAKAEAKTEDAVAKVEEKVADQMEKLDGVTELSDRVARAKELSKILAKTRRSEALVRRKTAAATRRSNAIHEELRKVIPGETSDERRRRIGKLARDIEEDRSKLILSDIETLAKDYSLFPTPKPTPTPTPRAKSAAVESSKSTAPPKPPKAKASTPRAIPKGPVKAPKLPSRVAWQG